MTTAHAQAPGAGTEEFAGRVVGDVAATMTTLFCALGDKLGLLRALADEGPTTPAELAEHAGANERYVPVAVRAGGFRVRRARPRVRTVPLPEAHAAVLADEGGVWFLGGGYQELVGMLPALDRIEAAFREGGGVPQAAYSEDAYTGMARLTQAWFDHHLTGSWLPLLPDVQQRLRDGISWADVGCGVGRALIRLAHEYPRSTFVGYDAFRRRSSARAARPTGRASATACGSRSPTAPAGSPSATT